MKRDPEFERRRQFYSEPKDDAAADVIHDVMQKIGFFQLQENNLDHIKAFKAAKESGLKVKQIRDEKEKKERALQATKLLTRKLTITKK